MGGATGGGGGMRGTGLPPGSKFQEGCPPNELRFKKWNFCYFLFSNISKIKWAQSEEKSEFGVRGFDLPESAPPPVSFRPPQWKTRGDAPGLYQ